jgi:hypothetical protein
MLHLALPLLLLAQPAPTPEPVSEAPPNPDYVTTLGLKVYDPSHFATPAEVDNWTDATMSLLSPMEQMELAIRLQNAVLIIYPDDHLPGDATPCGEPPPGYTLFGCTALNEQVMAIAARPCGGLRPSAAIFGHEVGHLMMHPHDYAPWYQDNRVGTIVEYKVCGP